MTIFFRHTNLIMDVLVDVIVGGDVIDLVHGQSASGRVVLDQMNTEMLDTQVFFSNTVSYYK